MNWVKKKLLRLVAKRVIDKTTGKEKWEKSTGKIGAIIALVTYCIQQVLPEFGINVVIPDVAFQVVEAFGISLSAWGIRTAQERIEDKTNNLETE